MSRKTGGREATKGVIPGRYCLSVGMPDLPAPDGWQWRPLLDLARLESGHTPSRKKPEYWGGDVPWIGIKDATGNNGATLDNTMQHTNDLGIANSAARILPENTVCLSRTASVGYVVVMGRPMATSQDFANWVCGPDLDHRFLKYVLLLENEALHRFSHGSTHKTIYYPELKAFHICIPPLEEQMQIADTLEMLDEKMALNREMAGTLSDLAYSMYRSWFVSLDPIWKKIEGSEEDLSELENSLFPDTFDENGVPIGWTAKTVGDVAEIVGGTTPSTQKREYWDNGQHQWATPKDLSGLRLPVIGETERKLTDSGLEKIGSGLSPAGSVLMSSRAPIGYLAIANKPMAVNQGFIVIREGAQITAPEALFWCKASMDVILANSGGSTFQEISKTNFRSIPYLIAPDEIREAFLSFAEPIMNKIRQLSDEIDTLTSTKDSLLLQLLTGQIKGEACTPKIERAA